MSSTGTARSGRTGRAGRRWRGAEQHTFEVPTGNDADADGWHRHADVGLTTADHLPPSRSSRRRRTGGTGAPTWRSGDADVELMIDCVCRVVGRAWKAPGWLQVVVPGHRWAVALGRTRRSAAASSRHDGTVWNDRQGRTARLRRRKIRAVDCQFAVAAVPPSRRALRRSAYRAHRRPATPAAEGRARQARTATATRATVARR